jgi:hypothetical protein
VIDEDDVTYTRKLLTIQVHKRLAGRPVGGQVAVETAGWQQVDGAAETELRFVDDQGVLLADGAEVGDSTRTDPLVKSLELRTLADLEAGIAHAEAAVRQGRVAARPYPGTSG